MIPQGATLAKSRRTFMIPQGATLAKSRRTFMIPQGNQNCV
jgi:hypothetical protein